MNKNYLTVITIVGLSLMACGTPPSQFGVYRQSDETIGVHTPKSATEEESHDAAVEECKKLGKRTATVLEGRKTVNDRFPMTYIYSCSN